jgi:hypothetical protein
MNRTLFACSAAAGASLFFIYALSMLLFLEHLDTSSIDLIESVIIVTQALRLIGIAAYFGSRPARIEVLLVLLSIETFVVMGLIVSYIVSPNLIFSQLAHTIFSTWIASLFTVLPPYLIFAGLMQMRQNRSLTAVLLPLALEFGFLTFAAGAMLSYGSTFTFGNFFDFLIAVAKVDVATGTIPELWAILILVPSVAIYCALLVYATISTATGAIPSKVTFVLPLLSVAIALVWVLSAIAYIPNTLLSFTAPGILVVVLLWVYMRR